MPIDDFVQDVARGAGLIQKRKFHETNAWREKGHHGDVVTEVDEECERYVIDRIRDEFPSASILSEERGVVGPADSDLVWVIDPLDGTRNYLTRIPFFCVSIGLARNGVPEVGAIYDAIHDEMFFASRGGGAYLNGEPISVAPEESIEDGIVSVAWVRRKVQRSQFVRYIEKLSRDTSYFRRFGSAALAMAYAACGRYQVYLQGGLKPWDVAAGIVLIEEAGGVVTDFDGRPVDVRNEDIELVTGNPTVHALLLERVIHKRD